jgi:hypothetical protein
MLMARKGSEIGPRTKEEDDGTLAGGGEIRRRCREKREHQFDLERERRGSNDALDRFKALYRPMNRFKPFLDPLHTRFQP